MNIWRLISFHEENQKAAVAEQFVQNGRIAIGWGNIGPLNQFDSKSAVGEAIRRVYPESTNSNIGGPSLWHLSASMHIGDLIVIDAQKGWEKIVEVTGEYEWNDRVPNVANYPEYFHQRTIIPREDILANQLRLITGTRPASGQSAQLVLFYYGSFSAALEQ